MQTSPGALCQAMMARGLKALCSAEAWDWSLGLGGEKGIWASGQLQMLCDGTQGWVNSQAAAPSCCLLCRFIPQ